MTVTEQARQATNRNGSSSRWSFIRACFLIAQRRTNGYLSCMECGQIVDRTRDLSIEPIEGKANHPGNAVLVCPGCKGSGS